MPNGYSPNHSTGAPMPSDPSSAPFAIIDDRCAGVVLRPGGSCTVGVAYQGPTPTSDHMAALTVTSGKPMKASVTRVIEAGVAFAEVRVARGGSAGHGGTITMFGTVVFAVADRGDWGSTLTTTVYNAAFEALSPECFDLSDNGTIGHTLTGETGLPAIGSATD